MSEEYTKLAADIIYSSLWEEDGNTCKVWFTILALKDRNGILTKNMVGIARIAKVSLETCAAAFNKFESPDPQSSSKEHEGRKLLKLPEGVWLVVNHQKYQEYGWSEDKKRFERERKAKWRANKGVGAQAPLPLEANNYDSSGQIPTFDEIKEYGAIHGVKYDTAKSFFDWHQDNNMWRNKYGQMINWKSKLTHWSVKDRTNEKRITVSGKGGGKPHNETGRSIGTLNEGTAHLYAGIAKTGKPKPQQDPPKDTPPVAGVQPVQDVQRPDAGSSAQ